MYPIDISPLFHYSTDVLGKRAQENETCTRVRNPERMEEMKKNLIVLLVIALVSVGLFAATNPSDAEFIVTTSVGGINDMKVTNAAVTLTSFDNTGNGFSALTIGGTSGSSVDTTTGAVTFSAYISTRSNNRNGYTVTLSATPMESAPEDQTASEINYTVSVAGTENGSYNTKTGGDAASVITITALSAIDVQSRQISLSVNPDEYNSAVEGSYTGTVTFNYVAN